MAAPVDWGHIRSSWNNRCLDADADTLPDNGTRVQLWDCNGTVQQGWRYEYVELPELVIHVQATDQCLEEAPGGGNGTQVQLWTCNYLPQQRWTMTYFRADNTVRFRNGLSGRYLDADIAHGNGNGGKVQVWDKLDGVNQHWW